MSRHKKEKSLETREEVTKKKEHLEKTNKRKIRNNQLMKKSPNKPREKEEREEIENNDHEPVIYIPINTSMNTSIYEISRIFPHFFIKFRSLFFIFTLFFINFSWMTELS